MEEIQRSRIFWSKKAIRRLRAALTQQGFADQLNAMEDFIKSFLIEMFPQQTVFVVNRAGGFSAQKRQHALTVEVFPEASDRRPTSHFEIVKVGLREAIDQELEGWQNCCPHDFRDDLVLLAAQDSTLQKPDCCGNTWKCIRYDHASEHINIEEIDTLESMARHAIRVNRPTITTMTAAIDSVFNRLHQHFYHRGSLESPGIDLASRIRGLRRPPHSTATPEAPDDWTEASLPERLRRWDSNADLQRVRAIANSVLLHHTDALAKANLSAPVDPVTAFARLNTLFGLILEDRLPQDLQQFAGALQNELPDLLRGPTHGDLHGRNILVGVYDEYEACFPVVFDYEWTGPNKLICWDFVKLEYELKARLVDETFPPASLSETAALVLAWEKELWQQTQRIYQDEPLTLERFVDAPQKRAAELILAIRRQARDSLKVHGRQHPWWEEYQFLVGLYAVLCAKYEYSDRSRMAAFVSGAVAVGLSKWNRTLARLDRNRYAEDPMVALRPDWVFLDPEPAFVCLQSLKNKKQAQQLRVVVDPLIQMIREFRSLPGPIEELIFVLELLCDKDQARHWYEQAATLIQIPEELYCRHGKNEKEIGFHFLDTNQYQKALEHFDNAAKAYHAAFAAHRNHYPGVNFVACLHYQAATMSRLQMSPAEVLALAHKTATDLLARRSEWPARNHHDEFWQRASVAELEFWLGNDELSAQLYAQVLSELSQEGATSREIIEKQRHRNQKLRASSSGQRSST